MAIKHHCSKHAANVFTDRYMQERLRGSSYDAIFVELWNALRNRYGGAVLLHWEDLASRNSFRLLANARQEVGQNMP